MTQFNTEAYDIGELADDYGVDPRMARRLTIALNHEDYTGTVVLHD